MFFVIVICIILGVCILVKQEMRIEFSTHIEKITNERKNFKIDGVEFLFVLDECPFTTVEYIHIYEGDTTIIIDYVTSVMILQDNHGTQEYYPNDGLDEDKWSIKTNSKDRNHVISILIATLKTLNHHYTLGAEHGENDKEKGKYIIDTNDINDGVRHHNSKKHQDELYEEIQVLNTNGKIPEDILVDTLNDDEESQSDENDPDENDPDENDQKRPKKIDRRKFNCYDTGEGVDIKNYMLISVIEKLVNDMSHKQFVDNCFDEHPVESIKKFTYMNIHSLA